MKINPKWQIQKSVSMAWGHFLLYRDDGLSVQREVHTTAGGERNYYLIDGDKREFRTEAALIQALSAKEAQ